MLALPAAGQEGAGRVTGRRKRRDVALAPVVKTVMLPRRIHDGNAETPHLECWGARTPDGVWVMEREESKGTPWLLFHQPSVAKGSYTRPVRRCGSLDECREMIASGGALEELEWRLEEAEADRRNPGMSWRYNPPQGLAG
jgi:hypothetical protein